MFFFYKIKNFLWNVKIKMYSQSILKVWNLEKTKKQTFIKSLPLYCKGTSQIKMIKIFSHESINYQKKKMEN